MKLEISKGSENKETILFVDDDALMRRVGEKLLKRLGYGVVLAETGEKACQIYRAQPGRFDMVILDLSMPGMDGEDTFESLRQIDGEACIVLSSGFDGDGKAEALLAQGAKGFVQKPFDMKSLGDQLKLYTNY